MNKKEAGKCAEGIISIRIHGRGGQGAVTTAQLLAIAAFHDGKYAQAFPFFGVERQGSPSTSFVRISEKPIQVREQIYCPDYAIVFDPALIKMVDASKGVKKTMIVNTSEKISKGYSQDVTSKAIKIFGKPIINTLILGSFAAFTHVVSLDSLLKSVEQKFAGKRDLIDKNKQAIKEAYEDALESKSQTKLRK
jgi:pyruvate ferredoxin oxidoreductase gamma subunit